MNQNKPTKFNKTRTSRGGKAPLGWWKIKQHRYDTTNHPVITSKEKCTNKIEILLSHQENQILNGVINTLQTNKRDVIRIATYELSLRSTQEAESLVDYASRESRKRGHTSRSKKHSIKLPKQEKLKFNELTLRYSLSEKETARLAIIWLGLLSKEESFTLTNSPRISQKELAREWSKTYDQAGSKLKELTKASNEAYKNAWSKAEELREEEYKRRGDTLQRMNYEGVGRAYSELFDSKIPIDMIDTYEELEASDKFQELIDQAGLELLTNRKQREIERIKINTPFLTKEEAESWFEEDERERKEAKEFDELLTHSTDEELIDQDPFLFFQFRRNQSSFENAFKTDEEWTRKKGETANQYFDRAFPTEFLKEKEKEVKELKQQQAIEEAEMKQRKKSKRDRENIETLKSEIDRWQKKVDASLVQEDNKALKHAREALSIQRSRLIELYHLKTYWDDLYPNN